MAAGILMFEEARLALEGQGSAN